MQASGPHSLQASHSVPCLAHAQSSFLEPISLWGHTPELPLPITSSSEFQAYCFPTLTSSLTAHSHWNSLKNVWCHQDLQAIDLTTTFLFTVDQAHTWFTSHESFITITSGRWTQFPFVFLFTFTCLKNTSWRSFFLPTSHYYPHVWTNLLKFMAIFFKWGLWYVSERILSHLLSPHTSLSLIS